MQKNTNLNYPVGDFLIRLKNASLGGHKSLIVPVTKQIKAVSVLLKKEGFLESIEEQKGELSLRLTFYRKAPLLTDLKLISKPGLRVYKSAQELSLIRSPSVYIVSTSGGLMTGREAAKKGIGGEVIAMVL